MPAGADGCTRGAKTVLELPLEECLNDTVLQRVIADDGDARPKAEQAVGLGLTGWVRNLPDGRVEVLAQGPADRIQALIDWCYQGPPLARVERIDVDWQPRDESYPGFAIRH